MVRPGKSASCQCADEDVHRLARMVRTLECRQDLGCAEVLRLNLGRFHIARWACRQEGLALTQDNLATILGGKAREVFRALARARTLDRSLS